MKEKKPAQDLPKRTPIVYRYFHVSYFLRIYALPFPMMSEALKQQRDIGIRYGAHHIGRIEAERSGQCVSPCCTPG